MLSAHDLPVPSVLVTTQLMLSSSTRPCLILCRFLTIVFTAVLLVQFYCQCMFLSHCLIELVNYSIQQYVTIHTECFHYCSYYCIILVELSKLKHEWVRACAYSYPIVTAHNISIAKAHD